MEVQFYQKEMEYFTCFYYYGAFSIQISFLQIVLEWSL